MTSRLVNRAPTLRAPSQPALTRTQDAITQVLHPLATAVQNTPMMGSPAPAWISPDFATAGWVNTVTIGTATPVAALQFHKDALGYVHIKGVVTNSTGGNLGGNLFILPSGFGPKEWHFVPAFNLTTGSVVLKINPNGAIVMPTTATTQIVTLGDIVFLAEGGGTGGTGPATSGHIGPSPHG